MARTVVYDGDMLNPVIDGNLALTIEQAILDGGTPADAPRVGTAIVGQAKLVAGDSSIIIDGDMEAILAEAELDLTAELDGEYGIVTRVNEGAYPEYRGTTEITPTTEEQTLQTANRTLLHDITIKPIPSYYGLIEWDGYTLTVR